MDRIVLRRDQARTLAQELLDRVDGLHAQDRIWLSQGPGSSVSLQEAVARPGDERVLDLSNSVFRIP